MRSYYRAAQCQPYSHCQTIKDSCDDHEKVVAYFAYHLTAPCSFYIIADSNSKDRFYNPQRRSLYVECMVRAFGPRVQAFLLIKVERHVLHSRPLDTLVKALFHHSAVGDRVSCGNGLLPSIGLRAQERTVSIEALSM